MKAINNRVSGVVVAIAGVLTGGCQLGVEQLEVGDEAADTSGTSGGDGNGDGDGDGDGQIPAADECWALGSNLAGGPEPLDFPLPECEVVCASGWGHGVAALDIAWTLDLEQEESSGMLQVAELPSGELVVMIRSDDDSVRELRVSPAGELLDERQRSELGYLWDLAVDDDGIIYVLRGVDPVQTHLTAFSSAGDELWSVMLAENSSAFPVLAAYGSGVVVAINSVDDDSGLLMRISAEGSVIASKEIPKTDKIAVPPGSDLIALANRISITWTDFGLFPEAVITQGVADMQFVGGLAAIDQQQVAMVGIGINLGEGASYLALAKQITTNGTAWDAAYNRATSWCEQPYTDEFFNDVVRLADGSLLIVGAEGTDEAHDNYVWAQPWVGHVAASGEVVAIDRGFWRGFGAVAAAGQDGSAYALLTALDEADQQHIYLRKYALNRAHLAGR